MNNATAHSRGAARSGSIAAAAVGALGASALFNRWSTRRAERDHPPIGRFVEVEGARVHYLERGSGSPIVLIHGTGTLLQDPLVSGLFDLLAQQHRVIAFDRPGYGYSARPRGTEWTPERQAKQLVDACASIGVDRPVVVGHSWGTLVATAWALDQGDRLSGLVLMSGYYYRTRRPDSMMAAVGASPVVGDLMAQTIAPLEARATAPLANRTLFSPNAPTDAYRREMPFALMFRPGQLLASADDSAQMPGAAERLSARYASLRLPMTILWGDGDKLVKQGQQSARLADELPHATAVELAGKGHMIHHVEPGRVAGAIKGLAASIGK